MLIRIQTSAAPDQVEVIKSWIFTFRAPNSRSGGHEFESSVRRELDAWKDPLGRVFLESVVVDKKNIPTED
jgi:hypothetical protein